MPREDHPIGRRLGDSERQRFERDQATLVQYLLHKVDLADWHGVSDAANDLRVLEAREQARLDCARGVS